MNPLVSVLLPVRNGARHLDEALDSLTAQTLEDFEVVAVDDGSGDGSRDILRDRAARDPRFRVLEQGPRGIVAALERARAAARAPLLARMDADDVAEPLRLERQLRLLDDHDDVVLCGTGIRYFPDHAVAAGARRYQEWLNGLASPEEVEGDLFVECPVAHPTFCMRARAVEAVGGYRDPGWPEDYDLVLRLWKAGGRLANVPAVLLRWREGRDRLHRTDPRYEADAFRRCKVHYLKRTLLQGRDGALVWGAGPTGKAFARCLLDEAVPVRAFVDLDPRKIGQEIHGAPVIAPGGIEAFRGALALAAVGQEGARREIRESLRDAGWSENSDFVAVA